MREEVHLTSKADMEAYRHQECLLIEEDLDFSVDLANFKKLKVLRISHKDRQGLHELSKLEELTIYYLRKEETTDLCQLDGLTHLEIVKSKIDGLDFLNYTPHIRTLKLAYLPNLTDVSALASVASTLEELEIEACKKVKLGEELAKLTRLKRLILDGMKLENISFVKGMPLLNHLSLVGSNVLDGDISPASQINYVGIDNRRHYSHFFDDKEMKIFPKG